MLPGAALDLQGVTLMGGNVSSGSHADESGGAVRNTSGQVSITASTLLGNHAQGDGGGIYNTAGTITINNSTLSDNSAGTFGGGLSSEAGQVTISAGTSISNNTAYQGGGISSANGDTEAITDCSILNNSASASPGINITESTIQIDRGTISGNSGNATGAIFNGSGSITVVDSSISQNIGPGLQNYNGEATVTGSTISGNIGENSDGILSYGSGYLVASGCTISDNGASGIDGRNVLTPSAVETTINGCLFSGNKRDGVDVFSGTAVIGDSTFSDNGRDGIYNSGDLTAQDLTVSGSGEQGIYTDGQATISDSIVTGSQRGIDNRDEMTLTRVTISGNVDAHSAGGIYTDGLANLIGCTISNNSAPYAGGIRNFGDLIVTDSTISGNHADTASGGFENSGTAVFAGVVISGNSAMYGGGMRNLGQLTLTNCTISNNAATEYGAGIYGQDGNLTIIGSTVSANTGDGLFAYSKCVIQDSTVGGNSGNGIFLVGPGAYRISNSTISGNAGGLTYYAHSDVVLDNTIIAGNRSSDVAGYSGAHLNPVSAYNLIGDPNTAGGLADGTNGNLVGDGNGHVLDIHTVLDTTLADNGGPTLTYALVPGSPAVNAGDPAFDSNATDPPTLFDQRGAGYSRVVGRHVDIGAYESGATFQTVVAGRQIFYDNSTFNGNVSGVGPFDAFAIATDKQALLPNGSLAGPQNVTSYSRGINGIMVDIAGSHPDITAADFIFRVGSNNAPDTWAAAPAPSAVVVLPGQGDGGSDRVEIVWPDGAIKNTYLEVIVAADAHTGLSSPDEFFFGNRVGDTLAGTPASYFVTNAADEIAARQSTGVAYQISNALDFDRNGVVNAADQIIARTNGGVLPRIQISPPPAPLAQPSGTSDALASKPSADLQNAVTASLTVPTESVTAHAESPAGPVVLAKAAPLSAAQVDRALAADWSYAADSLDELFSTGDANEVDETALELLGDALT